MSSRRRRLRARVCGLVVCLVVAVSAPATAVAGADSSDRTDGNPFAGARLYVDPGSNAAREAAADPGRAAVWGRIADRPQADWIGDWIPADRVRAHVRDRVAEVGRAGAMPVLVVYAIPGRDCGGYSGGGLGSAAAYLGWVDEVARGIGDARAAVVLEPDALAQADCLPAAEREHRYDLVGQAAARLAAAGGVAVYLDAGHSRWHPPQEIARRLVAAGVDDARGFALNVSNFNLTSDEIAYGREVSALVGGAPFVVDTSRNGAGPSLDPDDAETWCNPPGRALGPAPTTATGDPLVDALLWIKRPGESDGTCKGGPAAGAWWAEYAYGLAERAAPAPTGPSCPAAVAADHPFDDVRGSVHEARIACLAHAGILRGTAGASFSPGATLSRGQAAAVLARLLDHLDHPDVAGATTSVPADVAGTTHEQAIRRLIAEGIVTGRADGSYGPGAAVTRAQLAALLVRTFETVSGAAPEPGARSPFSDVDGPLAEAVAAAAARGWVVGHPDRTFRPGTEVTRAHAAAMVDRLLADLLAGSTAGG